MPQLSDNQIEALATKCLACEKDLVNKHRITSAYTMQDIRSFENQIELGIVGMQVRNYWAHINCKDPELKEYNLTPNIHHCIKCSKGLNKEDIVCPVFQVIDPQATNPSDPTDKGVALADRVFFIHVNCQGKASNILHTP